MWWCAFLAALAAAINWQTAFAAGAGSDTGHNTAGLSSSSTNKLKVSGIELKPTLAPVEPEHKYSGKPVHLLGGVEDKELTIKWDDWRNKLGSVIEKHVFHSAVESLIVPMGVTAYFHCDITADHHIKNLVITKSSGVLWYDRAVKNAVQSIDGDERLAFPAGSQRTSVPWNIGFTHSDKKSVQYIDYGDVEHQTMSNSDEP